MISHSDKQSFLWKQITVSSMAKALFIFYSLVKG